MDSSWLPNSEIFLVLLGVHTISLFFDWDCPGAIVLSIAVQVVVARNKLHAVLD